MKKTLIALAAAAMALTAVSCGEKEKGTSSEGVNAETTIEVSAGELMKDISERAAVEKADMTAKPTEKCDIPDDWKELTVDGLKIRVPSGVEELNADPGMRRFGDETKGLYLTTSAAVEYDGGVLFSALNPDTSEEKVRQAFSELGIEYNGTRLSFLKAALSITSADKTDENAEAFETAIKAKGGEFDFADEVYVSESDGHQIYIILDKKFFKSDVVSLTVYYFVDEKTAYTVGINAGTMEEALQIATNLSLA
ncbi:hypothetical protein [Ruminococcus flavefaciens]|uniref:Lipoprotein n=1 Tax=Ruminococcus flavefaciens TaxID=1265 RepID=A0A1M7GLA8_RUMFL|nr:hypothetical protein [Ruminococcus flavefaciens]SHM17182.1 hypothetical protein SAMN04487860_101377 [Ruminococcus flavefaciens]